jgi:hypothetical protein
MSICNTLRYRAGNSADGTMKRLVCLLLLATIVIVGIGFGTPAGRNITSNLRSGQAAERIPFSGENEAA